MGFGILFIGYVFLLNISFYAYTDILAAALFLYALEKLRRWNKGFKAAFFATIPFFFIGALEFFIKLMGAFTEIASPALICAIAAARMLSLCPLHICLLIGLKQITREVGLTKLETRATMLLPISPLVYCGQALFEIPRIFSGVQEQNRISMQFILLLVSLAFLFSMLIFIYKCYARICLPCDLNMEQKPSRFRFVNEYRAKRVAREKEETERRIAEMKQKFESKKNKKRKKRK